jgi:hypothetical protein
MKSYKEILKVLLELAGCLVVLYVIAYPCLRITRILIAREYIIYITPKEGGQLFEEHFDIDHGSAMVYGQKQPGSFLGAMYKPLSFIEVHLRGYGDYPKLSKVIEGPD